MKLTSFCVFLSLSAAEVAEGSSRGLRRTKEAFTCRRTSEEAATAEEERRREKGLFLVFLCAGACGNNGRRRSDYGRKSSSSSFCVQDLAAAAAGGGATTGESSLPLLSLRQQRQEEEQQRERELFLFFLCAGGSGSNGRRRSDNRRVSSSSTFTVQEVATATAGRGATTGAWEQQRERGARPYAGAREHGDILWERVATNGDERETRGDEQRHAANEWGRMARHGRWFSGARTACPAGEALLSAVGYLPLTAKRGQEDGQAAVEAQEDGQAAVEAQEDGQEAAVDVLLWSRKRICLHLA
ncbi:unnamed protein product [Closterium sp. Yama58-4]|nr:unnamed protein product [Closterium sp. Yama58-4]CAI5478376.1 unnamed protein product [Closterium sp. Yama58-4]